VVFTLAAIIAAGIGTSSMVAGAPQEGRRSTRDGVFTDAQSQRGETVFIGSCGGCHKPDQFVGEFIQSWEGKTAAELHDWIRERMPKDDPGSLTRQQYSDVITYIFEKNGLPSAKDELPAAKADLDRIEIRSPK
jgi:mono/diheme cytochrome c family protein